MTDKQLINSISDCVDESLYGFSELYPHLVIDRKANVVYSPTNHVPIVSGGGSGHEPFPAGYVGDGMLTASVSGLIFTSPPPKNILQAIHLATRDVKKVVLLVPNYTGDVLNFGIAAEIARSEGIEVETIIVGEDVSQEFHGASKAGKRGMCGLVLMFKILGYYTLQTTTNERSCQTLSEIRSFSESIMKSIASMGLCTTSCCKPGVGPLFQLGPNEMELGVGVHGEAGIARVEMTSAKEAVDGLLKHLTKSLKLKAGDEVIAMVNNLGGLSCLEEWLLSGEVVKGLRGRDIKIARIYSGCFFTSLNMAGVQVCILSLEKNKDFILKALDYPTGATAWNNTVRSFSNPSADIEPYKINENISSFELSNEEGNFLKECFLTIANNLEKEEKLLNHLDWGCGDGDCGTTFSRIGGVIKSHIDDLKFSHPAKLFFDLSLMMEESIGGTTGALYGLFFKGISTSLRQFNQFETRALAESWRNGVECIKKYSTARLGDRTMLDSLETGCLKFENEWRSGTAEAFKKAVLAARDGCQQTKSMTAFAGRASYTHKSQLRDIDAGAYAVVIWLTSIKQVLDGRK